MIKLHYIHENPFDALGFNVYLLLQEQPDSPFLILEDDEILGEIDFDAGKALNFVLTQSLIIR